MINAKKLCITLGVFCILALLIVGMLIFSDSNKVVARTFTDLNNTQNINEDNVIKSITEILSGGDPNVYVNIYDYSISPDFNYAYVTTMTKRGTIYYSLLDMKNKKDLFDSYNVAGNGELNTKNYLWTDNKLIIASRYNAEGGEGFPGIYVVNFLTQKFDRVVDMTDVCPSDKVDNCTNAYTVEIESFENNILNYHLVFDSYSVGQDPSFSYEKYENIVIK